MGSFSVKLAVWNPAEPSRSEEIEALVDTGASYSWISSTRLAALGIRPSRRMTFRTIEGRLIERDIAAVFVKVDGYMGGDNVVLAEPGDSEVLGAHTLESLGLTVDPISKVLVPMVGFALNAGLGTAIAGTRKMSASVEGRNSKIAKREQILRRPAWTSFEFRGSIFGKSEREVDELG